MYTSIEFHCFRDHFLHSIGRSSPVWEVSDRAKTAGDRPRTVDLAKHKPYHKDYQPERPLPCMVSPKAKTHSCTERVETLSKPKPKCESQFREPLWEVHILLYNTLEEKLSVFSYTLQKRVHVGCTCRLNM